VSLEAAIVRVTPFQQNCTLLWDGAGKAAAVVDPGGEVARIRRAIAEFGLRVERILLTHGHIDHAGGAAELKQALAGVPVEGPHEADRWLLDGLAVTGRQCGMAEARAVTPDRWLDQGDAVTVGPHRFEVLRCPGHTPGHVAFWNPAARLAVVGDVLFRGSIGRTDLPRGDAAALLRSIREQLLPLGDDVRFLCGHGGAGTLGEERRSNPFLAGAA